MVCVHCGGELSVGARFCGDCGVAVLVPPPGSSPPGSPVPGSPSPPLESLAPPSLAPPSLAPPEPSGTASRPSAFISDETDPPTFSALVTTRWHLVLPDGTPVPVEGPVLIGRRPDGARGPHGARLLTVEDPSQTMSRTHLALTPGVGGGVVATDLSGRNGIVVTGLDGVGRRVTNASIELTAPCRIGLGSVNTWLRMA